MENLPSCMRFNLLIRELKWWPVLRPFVLWNYLINFTCVCKLPTLTSQISVRSHLFFFELLGTGFRLIWVVTLIFFKEIRKFAQKLIQILFVLHAELLNIRLKIVIFSTFTLYLKNMWAKTQTVHVLGHTYYFEGTKVLVTLIW